MPDTYFVGIDLGTTNCALAFARTGDDGAPVESVQIPQPVAPGEAAEEPLLPSFLFIEPPAIVGTLAQKRGVETLGRLVASAKSWLSHAGVDRTAKILPNDAAEGIPKLSPVEASREYLAHLKFAWNQKMPDAPFDKQQVLITVPASFDAVARELTMDAAKQAGFRDVLLLEEPQAAFYAWIERHPDWRERVRPGDRILVIDIGGGTTDFTLIAAAESNGSLELERVAVGDHILLGGDNIDLAIARHVEAQMAAKNTRLDRLQFHALWQQARVAKEKLLGPKPPAEQTLTVLGKGTGLVGGTIKTKVARDDVERILLDGFLPKAGRGELPARRRAALAEIGLPYAADAAITRHLAQFVSRAGLPTHVLFNGGVLRAAPARARILEVLNGWLAEENRAPVKALAGEDLTHAVARGAAYYGMARAGNGVRIRGGVPRTYYVAIESAMPAVPGMTPPLKALSVAPFGMEEGTSLRIDGREFGLTTGEPAQFRFFASAARRHDEAGAIIEDIGEELQELSPIEVSLEGTPGEHVPVTIETVVTETGVLELWCVARDGRRWKLEFNVRERVSQ